MLKEAEQQINSKNIIKFAKEKLASLHDRPVLFFDEYYLERWPVNFL